MRKRISKYTLESSSNRIRHTRIKGLGKDVNIYVNSFNPYNPKIKRDGSLL